MSFQRYQIKFGGNLTAAVKALLIINSAIFLLQWSADFFYSGQILSAKFSDIFGINHQGFILNHYFWQTFTYMFLHGGWLHIIFNLLTLWMFGSELEMTWGSRKFIIYYLISGIGAGLCIALLNYYMYTQNPDTREITTIGASGAIYALLLAYGLLWPNREVLLYFLFPIKIKYLLIVFGLIEFFGTLSSLKGPSSSISHIGHIGGLITGFILFMLWKRKTRKTEWFFTRFFKRRRFKQKQKEIDIRIKAKQIIDDLLDKIAHEGLSSLTDKEKKDLDWARKFYYPSDRDTMH
jgi:membrane associated rhomboid family serine protease